MARPRVVTSLGSLLALATGCRTDVGAPEPTTVALAHAVEAAPAPTPAAEPSEVGPRVTLAGETRAPEPVGPEQEVVYARAPRTFVYERPADDAARIGYLRAGARVAASREKVGTSGCPGGWRALRPRGFLCVGPHATVDPGDPIVAALAAAAPDPTRKLPYIYGTVRKPGPVYARLPSDEELRETERGIDDRMQRWLDADGEVGASYAQFVWLGRPGEVPDPAAAWRERRSEGVPSFLSSGGSVPRLTARPRDPGQLVIDQARARVGYSFAETFLWRGRRYGLTPELEIVPTDRLRPIQGSDFHGVELGHGVSMPLALVRQPGARYVIHEPRGNRVVEGPPAPYREAVPLTGRKQFFHGVLHFETRDGKWLSDRDASRLDPAKKLPGWAVKGERWIDVNITKQSLVLYEGTEPVYATLVSTGEAGIGDAKSSTATKRGIFRIHAKHVSTTMASTEVGEEFELRDVPYVQYFDDDGHALHGAYWHDRFGIPKSHGCINLAPEDARRIFFWTAPHVPDGWHGASEALRGTVLFVHQ